MPGIFVQTLAFASITTAIALADDMKKGLIDRFRSLPMARSAVLSGRTFADILYNTGILIVLMLSGLVVGWRVNNGLGDFIAAVALLLFFTYAMAWIGVFLGLVVPTVEVAQQLGFLIIFPITFVSNAFCRRRRCPASSSRSPSGTRSARSPAPPASCSATRTRSSRLVPRAAPRLHVDRLASRAPRGLRPAGDPEVPRYRSLTASAASGESPAPGTIASRGSRPFVRARALPRDGPRVRSRPGRTGRRGDRPRGAVPVRAPSPRWPTSA